MNIYKYCFIAAIATSFCLVIFRGRGQIVIVIPIQKMVLIMI